MQGVHYCPIDINPSEEIRRNLLELLVINMYANDYIRRKGSWFIRVYLKDIEVEFHVVNTFKEGSCTQYYHAEIVDMKQCLDDGGTVDITIDGFNDEFISLMYELQNTK